MASLDGSHKRDLPNRASHSLGKISSATLAKVIFQTGAIEEKGKRKGSRVGWMDAWVEIDYFITTGRLETEELMKKAMNGSVSHTEETIIELRADRQFAVEYLKTALEELDDPSNRAAGLLALRDVVEAYGDLGAHATEYHKDLIEALRNPEKAVAYLDAALEKQDRGTFLLALRNVAEANGGLEKTFS